MNNKILIVEDDKFIREMYQSELTRSGFQVVACSNGEESLKILQQDKFDLMLLDIMLPGINGLEVLKQVKTNTNTKNLKVVLLTNLGQDTVIKQGFKIGAAGYLIKSAYNPDQIIREVKGFMVEDKTPPIPQ